MQTDATDTPAVPIPDSNTVRRRLAVVLTEVGLLRAQLRVSARAERELERLRCQQLPSEERAS